MSVEYIKGEDAILHVYGEVPQTEAYPTMVDKFRSINPHMKGASCASHVVVIAGGCEAQRPVSGRVHFDPPKKADCPFNIAVVTHGVMGVSTKLQWVITDCPPHIKTTRDAENSLMRTSEVVRYGLVIGLSMGFRQSLPAPRVPFSQWVSPCMFQVTFPCREFGAVIETLQQPKTQPLNVARVRGVDAWVKSMEGHTDGVSIDCVDVSGQQREGALQLVVPAQGRARLMSNNWQSDTPLLITIPYSFTVHCGAMVRGKHAVLMLVPPGNTMRQVLNRRNVPTLPGEIEAYGYGVLDHCNRVSVRGAKLPHRLCVLPVLCQLDERQQAWAMGLELIVSASHLHSDLDQMPLIKCGNDSQSLGDTVVAVLKSPYPRGSKMFALGGLVWSAYQSRRHAIISSPARSGKTFFLCRAAECMAEQSKRVVFVTFDASAPNPAASDDLRTATASVEGGLTWGEGGEAPTEADVLLLDGAEELFSESDFKPFSSVSGLIDLILSVPKFVLCGRLGSKAMTKASYEMWKLRLSVTYEQATEKCQSLVGAAPKNLGPSDLMMTPALSHGFPLRRQSRLLLKFMCASPVPSVCCMASSRIAWSQPVLSNLTRGWTASPVSLSRMDAVVFGDLRSTPEQVENNFFLPSESIPTHTQRRKRVRVLQSGTNDAAKELAAALSGSQRSEGVVCPICLDTPDPGKGVHVMCSNQHFVCGSCFGQLANKSAFSCSRRGRVRVTSCPVCRERVTLASCVHLTNKDFTGRSGTTAITDWTEWEGFRLFRRLKELASSLNDNLEGVYVVTRHTRVATAAMQHLAIPNTGITLVTPSEFGHTKVCPTLKHLFVATLFHDEGEPDFVDTARSLACREAGFQVYHYAVYGCSRLLS